MSKLVKQLGTIDRGLHKKEIIDLAQENAQAIIESGKYDLLKVYVELKRYETYLKGLMFSLKSGALTKAQEKSTRSFEYNDAKVNVSTRTKWDFSLDKKWFDIDAQIKELTIEKKEREQFLKDNNKLRTVVNKETGEIIEQFELPTEIIKGLTVRL